MSITIQIDRQLEKQIQEEAARRGLSMSEHVTEVVKRHFKTRFHQQPALPSREAELLQKINLAISVDTWELYRELIAKKENGTITDVELKTLIGLSDQIEMANAERMGYLAELALLRGVTLAQLLEEFQLNATPPHA